MKDLDILQNFNNSLENYKIFQSDEFSSDCSQEKLIIRPSLAKIWNEPLVFFYRIHDEEKMRQMTFFVIMQNHQVQMRQRNSTLQ